MQLHQSAMHATKAVPDEKGLPRMANTSATVTAIYRYPVKGLTPEAMDSVALTAGETLPFDRAYAIENGPGRFDPDNPKHLPKIHFLMLMRNERLATLRARFDDADRTLTILRDGKQVARGNLATRIGRQMIEQFLAAYMSSDLRGPPHIVQSDGHSFSDVAAKCVHIVNLATVREVERVMGRPVAPLRFRANVYIDGLPPWSERQWVGKTLQLGPATLEVFDLTVRCAATNVDPETGARDTDIPALLLRTWQHSDLGIYAKVVNDSTLRVGDTVTIAA